MVAQPEAASFWRRIAAAAYDAFLIISLWMITTFILVMLTDQAVGGFRFQLLLYLEALFFYFTFWRIKGQTLGMQAWRIRAENADGGIMSGVQCLIRFLAGTVSLAALGIGFLWILFNREKLAWHDIVSDSRVIYLGKRPSKKD
ncbi:MAG: RDD family protein [Pseudomonadales bacterium]|nr:RDD family protein [Pseudomonadales bacterium]